MSDWQQTIAERLLSRVANDGFWNNLLTGAIYDLDQSVQIHLAVFSEPFLTYILNGRKKVDSRFSSRKQAPYGKVKRDDILLVKASGGPIVAVCRLGQVWFYKLDKFTWQELRYQYAEALCAMDPDFWDQRREAAYATLMQLENVQAIDPFMIEKRDRRAWVIIRSNFSTHANSAT